MRRLPDFVKLSVLTMVAVHGAGEFLVAAAAHSGARNALRFLPGRVEAKTGHLLG